MCWKYRGFDTVSDRIWDNLNKGVSFSYHKSKDAVETDYDMQRQWKDIRHKYVQDEE